MKIGVWKYNDIKNYTAHFRGYVVEYKGIQKIITPCREVRPSRALAEKDATIVRKQKVNQNRVIKSVTLR